VESQEVAQPQPVSRNSPVDILGSDPLAVVAVGPEVLAEITNRWTTFSRIGIDKNKRKTVMEKYPPPGNVEGLLPPKLNAEISACLSEALIKQDNFFVTASRANRKSCVGHCYTHEPIFRQSIRRNCCTVAGLV